MSTREEQELDLKKYVVNCLRKGDMREPATNRLMDIVADNPAILNLRSEPAPPTFEVRATRKDSGDIVLSTCMGPVEVNDRMFRHLASLYIQNNPSRDSSPQDFLRAAFLLLFRYSYVDPGMKRQGYLPPRYFATLRRAFEIPVSLEGFASALNTSTSNYCSILEEVESPFGSIGDFLTLKSLRYDLDILLHVNPPRIGHVTLEAVTKLESLLKKAMKDTPSVRRYAIFLHPVKWDDVTEVLSRTNLVVHQIFPTPKDSVRYISAKTDRSDVFPRPILSVLSTHPDVQLTTRTINLLKTAL